MSSDPFCMDSAAALAAHARLPSGKTHCLVSIWEPRKVVVRRRPLVSARIMEALGLAGDAGLHRDAIAQVASTSVKSVAECLRALTIAGQIERIGPGKYRSIVSVFAR